MKKMKFIEKINSLLYLEFIEKIAGKSTEISATPNHENNSLLINFKRSPFEYKLNLEHDKAYITFGYSSSNEHNDYALNLKTPDYISDVLKKINKIDDEEQIFLIERLFKRKGSRRRLEKDINVLLFSIKEGFEKWQSADKELSIISDMQKQNIKNSLIKEISDALQELINQKK